MSIKGTQRSLSKMNNLVNAIDQAVGSNKIIPATPLFDQQKALELKQAIKKDGSILSVLSSMLSKSPDGVIRMPQGIAKRILEEANFPRQRPVKASRLEKHQLRLKNKTWRGDLFPITFAIIPPRDDQPQKLWLVNGQHRVTVIAQHDQAVPIKIILASVDSEEEAATLYTYFDDPAESRSDMEVLDAKGVVDTLKLPKSVIQPMYVAMAFLRNDLEPAHYQTQTGDIARDREARMHEIKDWATEAEAFWKDIQTADPWTKKRLLRGSIMAVALFTYRYQPAKAHEFWTGIARDDGLKKGDPRDTLLKDFRSRGSNDRGQSNNNQRAVVLTATLAWNAFCEKRELVMIKIVNGAQIKLWGTPYQNGNRR